MADVGNIIITAAKSVGEVVALGVVGYAGAQWGLLTHDALRYLSRLIFYVLMPSLIFGLSQHMSVQNLRSWAILPISSIAHMIIAATLARAVAAALRVKCKGTVRMMVLSCAFDNWAAMPLCLVAGIATSWEKLKSDKSANTRGQAMCVIYSIPWTFTFFSVGLKYLRGGEPALPEEAAKVVPVEPCPTLVPGDAFASLKLAIAGRGAAELVQLVVDHGGDAPESARSGAVDVGAATHRFMQTPRPSDPLPVPAGGDPRVYAPLGKGAGAGQRSARPSESAPKLTASRKLSQRILEEVKALVMVPSIVAQVVALVVGMAAPVRHVFFGEGALSWVTDAASLFGKTIVPIATLVLGASMQATVARMAAARKRQRETKAGGHSVTDSAPGGGQGGAEGHDAHESSSTPSLWVTLATCITRLVVLPAIAFPLSFWVFRSGLLGDKVDPLLQLVVLLQAIMPGAEQVVVIYKLYGFNERAMNLAFIYLVEYVLSIFTISGFLVVAMSLIK